MPKEWISKRIGELGRVVTGKTPSTKTPENFEGPYPFVTIPDLDGRAYITETARTLSELGANAIKGSLLPAGAVMISCIATIGRCGITSKPSFTNQQINSVIPKSSVDARFLYYSFTQLGKELERAGGGGSVYTNVSKSRFSNIVVRIPSSLSEQREIATILGALDDKIELNRRMSETLDRMAEAIFCEWFGSNSLAQDEDTLQPPTRLRDVLTLAYGKGLRKADRVVGPVPVFGSGGVFDYHNEALIDGPAIIVGRKGTVGSIYWVDEPSFPGDTVFYVQSELPLTYCFYLLRTLGLKDMNTDAAVPGLNRENAYRLEVPSPPTSLIEQFDSVAGPMRERIRVANVESQSLAELRDSLLPKLISGELRIPEAEQLVSEVA